MYAIKAEVSDPNASSWTFKAQKTMYGGKRISTEGTGIKSKVFWAADLVQ